jgi:hypothetical protein
MVSHGVVLGRAVRVGAWALAGCVALLPIAAYADHPGAGTCEHGHFPFSNNSNCNASKVGKVCETADGAFGTCTQTTSWCICLPASTTLAQVTVSEMTQAVEAIKIGRGGATQCEQVAKIDPIFDTAVGVLDEYTRQPAFVGMEVIKHLDMLLADIPALQGAYAACELTPAFPTDLPRALTDAKLSAVNTIDSLRPRSAR